MPKGWTDGLPVVPPTAERIGRGCLNARRAGTRHAQLLSLKTVRFQLTWPSKVAINSQYLARDASPNTCRSYCRLQSRRSAEASLWLSRPRHRAPAARARSWSCNRSGLARARSINDLRRAKSLRAGWPRANATIAGREFGS
jgi:hypothetical protein